MSDYKIKLPEVKIVSLNEYEKLIQENIELHQRIHMLTNESNSKLNNELMPKNLEIELLRKENEELKNRIKILEEKIKEQDISIQNQKIIIKKQEKKIKKQNKKINNLKNELGITKNELGITKNELETTKNDLELVKNKLKNTDKMKNYKKIIIGIQDLNSLEKLESKLNVPNELSNLKNERINTCHFINSNYSQLEKDLRINFLIDKINNIDSDVLDMFNNIYPNLINDLKPFLVKKTLSNFCPTKDKQLLIKINTWWEFD
jgi:chromosome segregation ATPase